MASTRSLVRHADRDCEFVVDLRHLPLVVTTWFGSPTLALVEKYDRWLQRFIEASSMSGRRVVLLDDASRAERPTPPVRGRLAQLECPAEVVVARLIVAETSAIRGAVKALTWTTNRPLTTVESMEDGVEASLKIFAEHGLVPPRRFEIEKIDPAQSPAREPI